MSKHTPIENLMDLDDIFYNSNQKMQSMDGYPPNPNVNSNYNEQMMSEINERQNHAKTVQNKLRHTSDFRKAVNGGADPNEYDYHLGPRVMQQPQYVQPENYYPQQQQQQYAQQQYQEMPQLSCIDVARHIKYCPICSKFYENDKSPYIICIVILVIICIILLKKVIESFGNKA